VDVKIGFERDCRERAEFVGEDKGGRRFEHFFAKNEKVKIFGKRKFEGLWFFQKMKSEKICKKKFWDFWK
jgi:hypothetical protein